METISFANLGPCPRCNKIGPIGATCLDGDCAKYKPTYAINQVNAFFKDSFDLFDEIANSDSSDELLGTCVLCDDVGPLGCFCTSDECMDTGAIYDTPYKPTSHSAPNSATVKTLNASHNIKANVKTPKS